MNKKYIALILLIASCLTSQSVLATSLDSINILQADQFNSIDNITQIDGHVKIKYKDTNNNIYLIETDSMTIDDAKNLVNIPNSCLIKGKDFVLEAKECIFSSQQNNGNIDHLRATGSIIDEFSHLFSHKKSKINIYAKTMDIDLTAQVIYAKNEVKTEVKQANNDEINIYSPLQHIYIQNNQLKAFADEEHTVISHILQANKGKNPLILNSAEQVYMLADKNKSSKEPLLTASENVYVTNDEVRGYAATMKVYLDKNQKEVDNIVFQSPAGTYSTLIQIDKEKKEQKLQAENIKIVLQKDREYLYASSQGIFSNLKNEQLIAQARNINYLKNKNNQQDKAILNKEVTVFDYVKNRTIKGEYIILDKSPANTEIKALSSQQVNGLLTKD